MYTLCYTALTHPGKVAANNEDNFFINGEYRHDVNQPCFQANGEVSGCLTAAVCDGMGGHELGEAASLIAVQTISEFGEQGAGTQAAAAFCQNPTDCINKANDRICMKMREEQKRIGSTISLLNFDNDSVQAVNMGDSRIYRLRGEVLEQLSVDHTVMARMLRMGQITPEEAKQHPLRHQITQYLGIFPEEMLLEPASTPVQRVAEGDRYLMCSDGLTDMLPDEEIRECLNRHTDIEEISQKLIQGAIDAGGRDNITVIIIEVRRAGGYLSGLSGKLHSKLDEWRHIAAERLTKVKRG